MKISRMKALKWAQKQAFQQYESLVLESANLVIGGFVDNALAREIKKMEAIVIAFNREIAALEARREAKREKRG